MLIKLAWRNIWRNKRRSYIVITSIFVGIVSILFMDALNTGALYQMLYNSISTSVSHIQIHRKGYNDNKIIQSTIPDQVKVETALSSLKEVKYFSRKVISLGLISNAENSSGAVINGINPVDEKNISKIKNSIVEGNYLTEDKRQIVIGKELAKKINSSIGDKIVVMSNTPDGKIGSDVFRVVGLFKTEDSNFDKTFAYIPFSNAQSMLELANDFHEYSIALTDYHLADVVKVKLQKMLGSDYEILTYKELLPFVIIQMDMYKEMMYIINLIVGLALIFGVINAMLMSVYERIQEIGVLMSIGMRNNKIFRMIISEAFILGIMGTFLGVIFGYIMVEIVSHTGIDFSLFAESLNSFGMGAILYPRLELENLISTLVTIPFITIVGAVYPAIKAIRLEPVKAIKYV